MKITIDTKEDSPDEIKTVIQMLSSVIGANSAEFSNVQPQLSQEQPVLSDGIFGMFAANNEQSAPFASSEVPNSEQASNFFSENREEVISVDEPTVVEGIKKQDSTDDVRIIVY